MKSDIEIKHKKIIETKKPNIEILLTEISQVDNTKIKSVLEETDRYRDAVEMRKYSEDYNIYHHNN